jgi:hypothetical protein
MSLTKPEALNNVCQLIATGQWFSSGTPVSPTNKTDHHDITEILLKVALNTIPPIYKVEVPVYVSSQSRRVFDYFP